MAMLTWDQFLTPVLRVLSDGEVWRRKDVRNQVQNNEGVTDAERKELMSSGERRVVNRVNWAISYLGRVGAIESPQRAMWQITDLGRELLHTHPEGMTKKELFTATGTSDATLCTSREESNVDVELETSTELDPYEQIEEGSKRNQQAVAAELLEKIHGNEPEFFERAVFGSAHRDGVRRNIW